MSLTFTLADREHARSIDTMRIASGVDLAEKLGLGSGSTKSRLGAIRDRIHQGDPENLHHATIYCACEGGQAIASVIVSTFPPGFWKKQYWMEPGTLGLGVFNLVVHPDMQRRGIGTFMMREVELLAQSHGIRFVRLDAYTVNPFSNGFYRAIGYEERAVIDLRGTGLVLYEKRIGLGALNLISRQ